MWRIPSFFWPRDETTNILERVLEKYDMAANMEDNDKTVECWQTIEGKLCKLIGIQDVSPTQVIEAIVDYAKRHQDNQNKAVNWLSLHFARMLVMKYRLPNKDLVRSVMTELFWCTGCIEQNIILPDQLLINSLWCRVIKQLQVFRDMNLSSVEYFLKMIAGYKVDLSLGMSNYASDLYQGRRFYPYIDLQVWFRDINLNNLNDVDLREMRLRTRFGWASPLYMACVYHLDDVVLILLRYNANPQGPPFQLILKQLENDVFRRTHPLYSITPKHEQVHRAELCLRYCLRAMGNISMRVGSSADVDKAVFRSPDPGYLVTEEALGFVPINRYKEPVPLKHHCRLVIRKKMFASSRLPSDIYSLRIPNTLKRYLDLQID